MALCYRAPGPAIALRREPDDDDVQIVAVRLRREPEVIDLLSDDGIGVQLPNGRTRDRKRRRSSTASAGPAQPAAAGGDPQQQQRRLRRSGGGASTPAAGAALAEAPLPSPPQPLPPPPPPAPKAIMCAICLDDIEDEMASTVCGHVFCYTCIMGCIKATKRCPNCRKALQLKQVHRLYLPA